MGSNFDFVEFVSNRLDFEALPTYYSFDDEQVVGVNASTPKPLQDNCPHVKDIS